MRFIFSLVVRWVRGSSLDDLAYRLCVCIDVGEQCCAVHRVGFLSFGSINSTSSRQRRLSERQRSSRVQREIIAYQPLTGANSVRIEQGRRTDECGKDVCGSFHRAYDWNLVDASGDGEKVSGGFLFFRWMPTC